MSLNWSNWCRWYVLELICDTSDATDMNFNQQEHGDIWEATLPELDSKFGAFSSQVQGNVTPGLIRA
jgi:hypothetical protein